jgi:hypothetical protein
MGGQSAANNTAMNSGGGGVPAASGADVCDGVLDANMTCLPYCDKDAPMCPDGSTCTEGKIPGEMAGEIKEIHYCKLGANGNLDPNNFNEPGDMPDMGGAAGNGGSMGEPMSGGMSMMPDPEPDPSMEPAEIMCDGEPIVLPNTVMGDYAPASRVSKLDIPKRPADAFAAGCDTVGDNNGSGLSGLLTFIGDLSTLTQPDADGNYDVLLLFHLAGWNVGEEPGDNLKLNLYVGDTNANGEFVIDLDSFEGRDPMNESKLTFDGSVDECVLQSEPGNFQLALPILPGLDLAFNLTQAKVQGRVAAAEKGFDMTQGTVTGYLTRDAVVEIVRAIKMACDADNPPSLCSQAAALLNQPEEQLVSTIVTLISGFDTRVTDDGVEGDCGDECNAVSVCLVVESEAINIVGLSDD